MDRDRICCGSAVTGSGFDYFRFTQHDGACTRYGGKSDTDRNTHAFTIAFARG